MRVFAAALALFALAACATPSTPYQARGEGRYGYSEQQIEANRARVSFRGNTFTHRDQVETYLLYRAAELTIAQGFDFFVAAHREVETEHRRVADPFYPRFAPVFYYYSPRWGWRAYYDPFFSPFYDPFFDDRSTYEVTRYEATAEIAMFHGTKPADNADAYDAREVMARLHDQVVRPPAS